MGRPHVYFFGKAVGSPNELKICPVVKVSIVLAREEQTIVFVRDHLEDLRAVVEGETLCPDLGEVLRTAIGPASLAGQLAVRSTRAQH